MIDFHSHILPGIDDGSQTVEESIALLQMLSDQGISTVFATPHFSADRQSVDSFLEKRTVAYELLKPRITDAMPDIVCGAEVAYYPGISRMPELVKLRAEGHKLLLLEMPMSKWTEYTVKELIELSRNSEITLAIAHMERYVADQSVRTLQSLYENKIRIQCNASFFTDFWTKRKALSMLQNGEIHLIGSDCHNLTSRAPKIGKAKEVIEKKLGKEFLSDFIEYTYSLVKTQQIPIQ